MSSEFPLLLLPPRWGRIILNFPLPQWERSKERGNKWIPLQELQKGSEKDKPKRKSVCGVI
jgi:hypothetical protein